MTKEEKSFLKDPEFAKHCAKVLTCVVDGLEKLPEDIKEKVKETVEKSMNLKCPDSLEYFTQKINSYKAKDINEDEKNETENESTTDNSKEDKKPETEKDEDKGMKTLAEFIEIKKKDNPNLDLTPSDDIAYRLLVSILIDESNWENAYKSSSDTITLTLSRRGTSLITSCINLLGDASIKDNPLVIDPNVYSKTWIKVNSCNTSHVTINRRNISINTEKELQFIIDRLCMLGHTSVEKEMALLNRWSKESRFHCF